MGISRKTSQKLIFASYHYSGFDFADTWVQQDLQHLQLLIGHLGHQDQVGNLLQINRDTLQLLLGYTSPPPSLSYPYQNIVPIAPPSWLITTWEFLNNINSKVTFTNPWNLPIDWQGDCHIMPQVLSQLVHIPKLICPRPASISSTSAIFTFKSSISLTLQPAQVRRLIATSGEDTGHPKNLPSNGPTKSSHLLLAGQSGARPSTYYSQTQSGTPEFSQRIASTFGSQTCHTTKFGLLIIIIIVKFYSTL